MSRPQATAGTSYRPLVMLIVALVFMYGVAVAGGWISSMSAAVEHEAVADPQAIAHAWAVTPFVLLLAAIALFPLLPKLSGWWHCNSHKLWIAAALGTATLAYLAWLHPGTVLAEPVIR